MASCLLDEATFCYNKSIMNIITKKEIFPIALIILAFLVGGYLYSSLPERIPSHWNAQGEIDSYSSKNFGVIFFPGLTLGIYLLMTFLPLIDPLKKNYSKFAMPYFWFKSLFVFFFILIYFYSLSVAMGFGLNINYFILPTISIMFIIIGILLPRIKKNYFVGIRTPWTIHSEEVWDKTHKFAGKLFVAAGVIALISVFFPQNLLFVVVTAILLAAFGSVVYSYFVFRNIKENYRDSKD